MTESTFTPVHGERHVTRDGLVTDGPVFDMRLTGARGTWVFQGAIAGEDEAWTEHGRHLTDGEHRTDLVAVYVPPPEPQYVPFDENDSASLTGRVIRGKLWDKCETALIVHSCKLGVQYLIGSDHVTASLEQLLAECEFADGTPCGKVVP